MKSILLFAALTISLATSAPAQSNCRQLHGNFVLTFDDATQSGIGRVTGGGILNGTLQEVVNVSSCCIVTPDPDAVTLLSDVTISTNHGQLRTSALITAATVFPFAYTEFGKINPNTSTGSFAGATGVIFLTGTSVGPVGDQSGPFKSDITGEICFAN